MKISRLFILLLCALIAFQGFELKLNAQKKSQEQASLKVLVLDPNRSSVPNASVTLIVDGRAAGKATTNAQGEASLSKLSTGNSSIRVEAKGFRVYEAGDLTTRPGANRIEVTLELALVEDNLVVGQDKREAATDPRGDAFTNVLTADQIAQLPDDPEEFEEVIKQMAGPGAVMRVNGFRGGKLPPKSQIREIRFRTNQYAAENHEAGFLAVDILTKPGLGNWHGSFNGAFRDESLNARNPFAVTRGPEQTRRFAFDLGGPLWRNRTSLFLAADGANEYDSKTIVAALPDGSFYDQVARPVRKLNLSARAEHGWRSTHTLRGEFQRNVNRRDNLGVGDFDLESRAYSTDAVEQLARFGDSGGLNKFTFNEFRFQAQWIDTKISPLSNKPTIVVQNAFADGGSQVNSNRQERSFEVADNLDIAFSKHSMRTGFLFEHSRFQSNELQNFAGTFIFSGLNAYQLARPLNYTRRFGNPYVEFSQYEIGWYFQDDYRIRKNLTLSVGLRNEWQSTIDERSNFAPRASVAWSPFKSGNTTLRAGVGVFYDWFAPSYYEQTLRVNGINQQDTVIQNPGFPNPISGGQAVILPPSKIQADPGMIQPTIYQASAAVEQKLPSNVMLRASYMYQRGTHLLRGRNINAPLTDGTRPDAQFGNINQIESSANSFNHLFNAHVNWGKPGRFFFGADYVFAKATNEADSPTTLPVNSFDTRAERGPSLTDIRHRFFLFSNATLPRGFRAGLTLQAMSALPYNITTGFDNNGDTIVTDRPAGVGRNSARGAMRADAGIRLGWGFGWGTRAETGGGGPQIRVVRAGDGGDMLGAMGGMMGGSKKYGMEFYVQATNALNRTNYSTFSGVRTSPYFGQPISAFPARRLETGMRFSF